MKQEDVTISEIAKKEIKSLEREAEKKKRDEILSGEKAINRKTFFKTLFGV